MPNAAIDGPRNPIAYILIAWLAACTGAIAENELPPGSYLNSTNTPGSQNESSPPTVQNLTTDSSAEQPTQQWPVQNYAGYAQYQHQLPQPGWSSGTPVGGQWVNQAPTAPPNAWQYQGNNGAQQNWNQNYQPYYGQTQLQYPYQPAYQPTYQPAAYQPQPPVTAPQNSGIWHGSQPTASESDTATVAKQARADGDNGQGAQIAGTIARYMLPIAGSMVSTMIMNKMMYGSVNPYAGIGYSGYPGYASPMGSMLGGYGSPMGSMLGGYGSPVASMLGGYGSPVARIFPGYGNPMGGLMNNPLLRTGLGGGLGPSTSSLGSLLNYAHF